MHNTKGPFTKDFEELVELLCSFILKLLFNLRVEIVEDAIENFFLEVVLASELCCETKVFHVRAVLLVRMKLEPSIMVHSILSISFGGSFRMYFG
jgi:hypothetical protein